jgi:hypothetical protein
VQLAYHLTVIDRQRRYLYMVDPCREAPPDRRTPKISGLRPKERYEMFTFDLK